jgi:AraC-like DNA-binding protein
MLSNFTRELELSDRLETQYLRVLYYDLAKDYTDSYHAYEYARLCTIIEGEKHIRVNDSQAFTYGPRDFLLLPPQSRVHMKMDRPTRALVFELSDSLVKDVAMHISARGDFDYALLVKDRVLCAQESAGLQDVQQKMLGLLSQSGGRRNKYMLDLFGQEMVYYLLETKGARQLLDCVPQSPVNRAIRFMKESYASPVSIGQIAGELGMSEAAFSQYFKKITGMTPKSFLTELRMEKAQELVGQLSVTDAAMELGYDNISHFIALFKERYGITPGQYKKRIEQGLR